MSLVQPDLTVDIDDWAAGFLDTPEPNRLPPGGTPSAANAWFYSPNAPTQNEYGVIGRASCIMGRRSGARLLTPTCLTADKRIDGLYEFRREGVAAGELLAVCNGDLKVWDGGTGFTLLSAAGFIAGAAIEFLTFRNLGFVMDGTTMKIYDGASVLPVGFVAPTAAPALAAVAPAGAGVTGTYQSLAVWYDSVHDHESSPSAYSAATAFAVQDRQHTKPAGAPPANVDKWRIYVRRTDINEVYFKLVAETVVGTATATEAVTDSARNLATALIAPLPNANDVPPPFAFMGTAQGYAFGVRPNDGFVYVSANGDPQSFHPKDKLGVARGDGQELTTCKAVGTSIIVQKRRKTYELTGDRMPFIPNELNPALGNHSQGSSVEAAGRYWAWDDEKGPYWTDLQATWRSLVEGRIANLVASVNRTAQIRCCHYKAQTLVAWIVATGSSTRLRTMLAYNYLTGSWLPPIYGIEYGAFTTFELTDGSVYLFVGDQWGRVYRYFLDDVEGAPSGTLDAAVTAADAGSVTAGAATFYTTGNGLKGMPVAVLSPLGVWQFRIVQSNTATKITIDTINGVAWNPIPDDTYRVYVGAIDWFWRTPMVDWGKPVLKKKGGYIYGAIRTQGSYAVTVRAIFDEVGAVPVTSAMFGASASDKWGSGLWGTMLWSGSRKSPTKARLARAFYGAQFELSNRLPNQPVQVALFGVSADKLPRRWASGPK